MSFLASQTDWEEQKMKRKENQEEVWREKFRTWGEVEEDGG